MPSKIEISHKTIIFTVVFIIGLWFLYSILDIVLLLFVSFVLMSALRPMVEWLAKRHFPRALSLILTYIIFFGIFGGTLISVIPSLVYQMTRFSQAFPNLISQIIPNFSLDVASITKQLAPIGENLIKLTVGLFSNIITLVTILVFTFYLSLERKKAEDHLKNLFGTDWGESIMQLLSSIENRLGSWIQGEFILMLTIGVLTYIGLTILRIDYALPLAIIAGFLEIVPTIGPILSAVPSVLIALTISPILALSVAAMYFIIQQLENNLIVPLVMRSSVGLSPIITIICLMVGARIAGVGGAILAVPIFLVVQEVLMWFLKNKQDHS